jgi:hypothetical protein
MNDRTPDPCTAQCVCMLHDTGSVLFGPKRMFLQLPLGGTPHIVPPTQRSQSRRGTVEFSPSGRGVGGWGGVGGVSGLTDHSGDVAVHLDTELGIALKLPLAERTDADRHFYRVCPCTTAADTTATSRSPAAWRPTLQGARAQHNTSKFSLGLDSLATQPHTHTPQSVHRCHAHTNRSSSDTTRVSYSAHAHGCDLDGVGAMDGWTAVSVRRRLARHKNLVCGTTSVWVGEAMHAVVGGCTFALDPPL